MNKNIRMKVYDKYQGHCAYCGKKLTFKEMKIQHDVENVNGGIEKIVNFEPACKYCNNYWNKKYTIYIRFKKLGNIFSYFTDIFWNTKYRILMQKGNKNE